MRPLVCLILAVPCVAQWSLPEVVERAGKNYAGVEVSAAEVRVAAARIRQVRTAFLPKGDLLAQVNRATRNNVFGMLLPQSVIAPISGPPLATNAGTNVWGTAAGLLVSWEPFDFGFRNARVREAEVSRERAEKALLRNRFEVESAAADVFFTILAADATVRMAQAALKRAMVLETVVSALASAGLKPEADASRARGEVAAAQAQVIQAREAARTARAALTGLTGGAPDEVNPAAGPFFANPPPGFTMGAAAAHPAAAEQTAAIEEASLRRKNVDYLLHPKFNLQTAVYGRGTGANPDGSTGGAGAGLYPNVYNWGAGFSVTLPLFELPAVRAQRQVEDQRIRAEQARQAKIDQDLKTQRDQARAHLDAAVELAATTPRLLEAAWASEQQARARYQAGLTNLVEVSDTQRFLLQAEVEDSLSRLAVWRSYLALAVAQGDLNPLLEAARR